MLLIRVNITEPELATIRRVMAYSKIPFDTFSVTELHEIQKPNIELAGKFLNQDQFAEILKALIIWFGIETDNGKSTKVAYEQLFLTLSTLWYFQRTVGRHVITNWQLKNHRNWGNRNNIKKALWNLTELFSQ